MKRQIIITDWKTNTVRHEYVDMGPGRAVDRQRILIAGRYPGTGEPRLNMLDRQPSTYWQGKP